MPFTVPHRGTQIDSCRFISVTHKLLLLQFFTLNNKEAPGMESLLFLLHAVYKFDTCEFHINSYNIVKVIVIWQCSLHLWTKAYIPCGLFSAATGTGTQHSAVPCHWHSGILAGPPPNDERVIICWCNWRTLGWMRWHYPPHNLWWPLWCAHLCVA